LHTQPCDNVGIQADCELVLYRAIERIANRLLPKGFLKAGNVGIVDLAVRPGREGRDLSALTQGQRLTGAGSFDALFHNVVFLFGQRFSPK
jgi:hypothetical protein